MTLSVLDALVTREAGQAANLPCRSNDPELFFAESPTDVELAKSLCRSCPVRVECLAGVHVVARGSAKSPLDPCHHCEPTEQ
jgi:WhiB family redox-sensing transcriptional regulator